MDQNLSELNRCIKEVQGSRSCTVDELVMMLKGLRQYRKTPTDVLRRKVRDLEELKIK